MNWLVPIVCALITGGFGLYGVRLREKLKRRNSRLIIALKDLQNFSAVEHIHLRERSGLRPTDALKRTVRRDAAKVCGRELSEQSQPAQLSRLIERLQHEL